MSNMNDYDNMPAIAQLEIGEFNTGKIKRSKLDTLQDLMVLEEGMEVTLEKIGIPSKRSNTSQKQTECSID